MLVTVKFHGLLKKLCPKDHKVEANSAYEALRIVCKQNEKALTTKNGHKFSCFVKECRTDRELYSKNPPEEINVIPSFCPSGSGSTRSAWIQTAIIVAVAVIIIAATAVFAPAALPAVFSTVWKGSALMIAGVWVGALAQHLQKKDKPDQNETQQNYAFGMIGNTIKVGTAIPIGYGRYRVYGHLLSYGTEATSGSTPFSDIQGR